MQGSFRSDVDLVDDPRIPGAVTLRRRLGGRLVSALLVTVGLGFGFGELLSGRPVVGLLTSVAALWLLALHARAELDQWTFDKTQVVRRSFDLFRLQVREAKVPASEIQRIGIASEGARSRAWLETRTGEQYALVQGDEAGVRRIAEGLARAMALAKAESSGRVLH
jgi:hypothetical protein